MKIKNKLSKRLFSFALCLVIGVFSTATVLQTASVRQLRKARKYRIKAIHIGQITIPTRKQRHIQSRCIGSIV